MPRDRFLKQSLGSLHAHIKQSRILVVGAGGIGCELLKNLVTTGFGEIHVVDLDTIDLSNLNRQFLFRHAHIKKSKALVAKDTAGKFNPNVKIEAHHANIKDPSFNIDWFKSFVIVFNALDNLDARRHVNKMCIAADVSLIESGTTGFNGQVQPIKRGLTECYDCTPKETPKSFPVCTIRSTPSQPIHCIVWAKSYLFNELFGISEDDGQELDQSEDADNAEEIATLKQEAAALKKIRLSMGSEEFARKVFEKVFTDDIERLRSMEDMWKTRKAPVVLKYDELMMQASDVDPRISTYDQRIWSTAENMAVFAASLTRLSTRLDELKANADTNAPPILTFDKDDRDALDFVASAANLRSLIFGIDTRSEFDVKQMAGNIIPAIATTNATTAALCVLAAFKVMQSNLQKAKMVFLAKSIDRTIEREDLRPPNPDCAVCSNVYAAITVDTSKTTLQHLVDDVLKAKLGYTDEMSISIDAGSLYDPDTDDNLPRTFADLGIEKDSFITVIDEEDEPKVNLVLAIQEKPSEQTEPIALLPDTIAVPKRPKAVNGAAATNGHASPLNESGGTKRKRDPDEAELEAENVRKRGKVPEQANGNGNGHEAIVLDDAEEGAIVLD